MLRAILALVRKDIRLTFGRGFGLVQALLLGLLLLFVFSLSQEVGTRMSPQGAATIFWLASAFCQVLVFNMLYGIEEVNGARQGLLLVPEPVQVIWISKGITGFLLIGAAQLVFLPAAIVFLGQEISFLWPYALAMIFLADVGMAALGSLLGALSQGQSSRESLLSIVLFPLLIPLLLAGIRVGAGGFSETLPEGVHNWLGIAIAFDALFLAAGLVLFTYVYMGED